jgi:xanthine/CO dehydrogenase XdhC/CoxF family maturation factor
LRDSAEILDLIVNAINSGRKMVLATVVDVSGSAYRRPGAHLLLVDDGRKAGSISAGCLENDLIARGEELFESSECLLLEYENDEFFGLNYGCDGTIFVFVQPINESICLFPVAVERVQETAREHVLATVFHSEECAHIGKQFLFDREAQLVSSNAIVDCSSDKLPGEIAQSIRRAIDSNCNQNFDIEFESTRVFFELIKPTIRLAIFGAGDDVIPLLNIANSVGLETHVIDSRPSYLDRFANQAHVYSYDRSFCSERVFTAPERTAAVVMSHNFELDKRFLSTVLNSCCAFIGVMGSRKRTHRLLSEIGAEIQSHKIRFPVGLDIGAETPEEIALSICSEVLAFFREASGQPLNKVMGTVHQRSTADYRGLVSERRPLLCTIGDTNA